MAAEYPTTPSATATKLSLKATVFPQEVVWEPAVRSLPPDSVLTHFCNASPKSPRSLREGSVKGHSSFMFNLNALN